MLKINLLEPKAKAFPVSSYKLSLTIPVWQPGTAWPVCCHIRLWGNPDGKTSFYTVKKVNTVTHYQEN